MNENQATILVIDDEPDFVNYIKEVVDQENFTIISAPSWTEAQGLIKTSKPDLVLLDWNILGAKDGFDPEALKHYLDKFREIAIMSQKYYIETALGKLSPEEFSKRIAQGREIMSLFFYHLYRKLSRERYRSILTLLESRAEGSREEDFDSAGDSSPA